MSPGELFRGKDGQPTGCRGWTVTPTFGKTEGVLPKSREGKEVAEAEAEASIISLREKGMEIVTGRDGESPYAGVTLVASPEKILSGDRINLVPVFWSHNGIGHYKGRGRIRTVWIAAKAADGKWAACRCDARHAKQVGFLSVHVRTWAQEEESLRSKGMGLAGSAMSDAFKALGL